MAISNDARVRVKKLFEPIALGLGRLGLTPDGLTLIGFAITVVGALLLTQQQWLAGGVVILVGGIFDMFDGTLARATNRVSALGAFMDSVFDRWGEALVYVAVIVGCTAAGFGAGAVVAAAAMAAAFMVSYTRSRSDGLGFTAGTGMAAVGLMPREVRLVILTVGLIAVGPLGGISLRGDSMLVLIDAPWFGGRGVLVAALAIIAIGATITTIQRILHVRAQAKRQTTPDPSTSPMASTASERDA